MSRLRLMNMFPQQAGGAYQQSDDTSGALLPGITGPSPQGDGLPLDNDPSGGSGIGPGLASLMNAFSGTNSPDYAPRTSNSSMFQNALANMPQRPESSGLRRVAGAIAGLGAGSSPLGIVGGSPIGFRYDPTREAFANEQVLDNGYNNKLNDWSTRVKALGLGATEEDRANTNERIRLNNEEANRIRQQNANTQQKKENDIRDSKINQLQQKSDEAQNKLDFAKAEAERKQGNADAIQKLHQATLDSLNAQRALDNARKDAQLEELQKQHDAQTQNWERQRADYERRLDQLDPMNRPTTQKTEQVKDAQGNITGTKTTQTGKSQPNTTTILTSPDGKRYDTSTWSKEQIDAAKKAGYK